MIGGIRRRRRARAGTLIVAAVAATLLAGCSEPLSGTATIAPYEPIPAASMTASMADPVPDAVSYSRDGRTVAVYREPAVCVGPADDPDGTPVCPTLPDDLDIGQALLDPTGHTLAVLEDFQQTYQGRMWLIDTDDGAVRQVPFPSDECGSPTADESSAGSDSPDDATGSTAGGPPTAGSSATGSFGAGSSGAGSSGAESSPTDKTADADDSAGPPLGMYTYGTWLPDGRLTAIGHGEDGSECLVLIDPSVDGAPTPVTVPDAIPPTSYVWNLPEAGGSTLVFLLRPRGDKPLTVGVVDVRTGDHRRFDLPEALRKMRWGLPVMAVSPDGATAVVGGFDPVTSRPAPVWLFDLSDGSVDRLATVQDGTVMDGAFSPDGTQVVLAIQDDEGSRSRLAVVPTDGGRPRTVEKWDGYLPPVLDMRWTRSNLMVPASLRVDVDLGTFGPVQLSD